MSDLKKQIEAQKRLIEKRKKQLDEDLYHLKKKFSSSITLPILGSFLVGYLFTPRKLFRVLVKSWTFYNTFQQIRDFASKFEHSEAPKKQSHPTVKSHRVTKSKSRKKSPRKRKVTETRSIH